MICNHRLELASYVPEETVVEAGFALIATVTSSLSGLIREYPRFILQVSRRDFVRSRVLENSVG